MKTAPKPRDRRPLVVIAALFLLLVAGVGGWALGGWGGAGGESAPGAATELTVGWPRDGRGAYEVRVVSTVRLNPGAGTPAASQPTPRQDVRQDLSGILGLRVLEVRDDAVEVGLQLARVEYTFGAGRDPVRETALAAPFLCTFAGGMPSGFRFPDGLGTEVQVQLEELVRAFQLTLPRPAGAQWTAVEQHGAGRYRAVYQRDGDSVVHKRKAAYLDGAGLRGDAGAALGTAQTAVLSSRGTLELAGDAPWLAAAELEDEIEVASEGVVVARVAQRAELRAVPAGAFPASLTADAATWLGGGDDAVRASRVPVAEEPAVAVVPQPATAEDFARFRAEVDAYVGSGGDDVVRMHDLARLLQQFPELARLMPEILARPDLPDPVASGLTHSLELAGTAESQTALVTLFQDGNRGEAARLRAIAALGGVARPTPAAVESLWRLAEAGTGAGDLAPTALLALGAMGRAMKDADPEGFGGLAAGLRNQLEASVDPESAVVALRAIGNAAAPGFQPAVSERLAAQSPMVRAAAAQALGGIDGASSLSDLTARMAVEPDGRVRAAIAGSVGRLTTRSEATFVLFDRLVGHEQDAQARGAMARYLVDHLDHYPDARATLEQLVATETDARTLSYVAGRLYRRK